MTTVPKIALTHAGKFHADDVFSAALLRLIYPDIQFQRVFSVPEDFDGLVFDIGWGKFDHHQSGAPVRENGVPYAAFGLLWREYGSQLVGEEAQRFDEHFIQPLDLEDNTGCGHPLAAAIAAFNPCWDSDENPDDNFQKALDVAFAILSRKIEEVNGIRRAGALVKEAVLKMQDDIIVLDRYAPWKQFVLDSSALFVVSPSQRGGFSAPGCSGKCAGQYAPPSISSGMGRKIGFGASADDWNQDTSVLPQQPFPDFCRYTGRCYCSMLSCKKTFSLVFIPSKKASEYSDAFFI